MSSRTNLKQQLMREQSELQEKREREQLNISLESSKAVSVPNYTFQPIPSNILTYESRLDNPTCYHITESKNRKVQEFLSQVHRPDNTRPANIHSLPSKFNVVSVEPSPNDLAAVLKNSTANHVEPDEFWDDFKNSTAFSESFADSGVDPSFSPTSETDIIEMFTSLTNRASTSAPCHATINPTEEPAINLTMENFKNDRRKKNNHNRIEKNRRCVINEHIKELFVLLPKPQEPLYEIVKDIRQSKGTILKASVDYMKALKEVTKKIPKLEEACFTNENIIRKLKLKMQEYEILLTSNGIPIPNPMWQPSTESDIKAIMKQEPHFGSVHEISPISSAAENNSQVALGIHTTLGQSSRLGKPILQFLTVQDNTASPTKLFKVTDSDNFQMCNYPAVHTSPIPEELMEDNLIANDVLLSSRSGSCTPETMDFLNS